MDGFNVSSIDLSMLNPETGNPIVANVYEVDGIDRQLSIGELVMAICLSRAAELEEKIIQKMDAMSDVTTKLESLTKVQEALANLEGKDKLNGHTYSPAIVCEWPGKSTFKIENDSQMVVFLSENGGYAGLDVTANTTVADAIAAISNSQDALNSVNQKDMIELQSKTNKRDQSYDLITNMIKSMGTVLTATTNNFG